MQNTRYHWQRSIFAFQHARRLLPLSHWRHRQEEQELFSRLRSGSEFKSLPSIIQPAIFKRAACGLAAPSYHRPTHKFSGIRRLTARDQKGSNLYFRVLLLASTTTDDTKVISILNTPVCYRKETEQRRALFNAETDAETT